MRFCIRHLEWVSWYWLLHILLITWILIPCFQYSLYFTYCLQLLFILHDWTYILFFPHCCMFCYYCMLSLCGLRLSWVLCLVNEHTNFRNHLIDHLNVILQIIEIFLQISVVFLLWIINF
jgi:hypothetical protein